MGDPVKTICRNEGILGKVPESLFQATDSFRPFKKCLLMHIPSEKPWDGHWCSQVQR